MSYMRLIAIYIVLISAAGKSYSQSSKIINEQREVVIKRHFKEVSANQQAVYRISYNKYKNQPDIAAFRVSKMADTLCLNDSSMLFANNDHHYAAIELGNTLYIWYDSLHNTGKIPHVDHLISLQSDHLNSEQTDHPFSLQIDHP